MKLLEVTTTVLWRRICLNWKWIRNKKARDGEREIRLIQPHLQQNL